MCSGEFMQFSRVCTGLDTRWILGSARSVKEATQVRINGKRHLGVDITKSFKEIERCSTSIRCSLMCLSVCGMFEGFQMNLDALACVWKRSNVFV